jgi:ribosomal protein S18 acetylase RimI-like enzyme
MTTADLHAVAAIAARVHPAFPEEAAIFAERLRLYPAGCLMLDGDGGAAGYCLSHPWRAGDPPALNTQLSALPAPPSTYYIHDLALMPQARGHGAATMLIARLAARARAERLPTLSLVAVNGSGSFWRHHGFEGVADVTLQARLASYDAAAAYMVRAVD